MITKSQARELKNALSKIEEYEKRLDSDIRLAISSDQDRAAVSVPSRVIGEELVRRYKECGHAVLLKEDDPDRVARPIEYTVTVTGLKDL